MVISRTHKTHSCCWAFSSGAVATFFKDLCLSRLGFEHPTSACWANALSYCVTAAALMSEAVHFLSYFGTTGSYVEVIFMTDNKSLNLLKFVIATFELSLFTCTRYNTKLVSWRVCKTIFFKVFVCFFLNSGFFFRIGKIYFKYFWDNYPYIFSLIYFIILVIET